MDRTKELLNRFQTTEDDTTSDEIVKKYKEKLAFRCQGKNKDEAHWWYFTLATRFKLRGFPYLEMLPQ